jgi:hypothetical protein
MSSFIITSSEYDSSIDKHIEKQAWTDNTRDKVIDVLSDNKLSNNNLQSILDSNTCYICESGESDNNKLIKPCDHDHYIHQPCLKMWLENRRIQNNEETVKLSCEICMKDYRVKHLIDYSSCIKSSCIRCVSGACSPCTCITNMIITGKCSTFGIVWQIAFMIIIGLFFYSLCAMLINGYTYYDIHNINQDSRIGKYDSKVTSIILCVLAHIIILLFFWLPWFGELMVNIYDDRYGYKEVTTGYNTITYRYTYEPPPIFKFHMFCRDYTYEIFHFIIQSIIQMIIISILQLIGMGTYNLFEYGDITYEFYPTLITFLISILLLIVTIIGIIIFVIIFIGGPYCLIHGIYNFITVNNYQNNLKKCICCPYYCPISCYNCINDEIHNNMKPTDVVMNV